MGELGAGPDRLWLQCAGGGLLCTGVNGIRMAGFSQEDEALVLGENLRAIYDL